MFHHLQNYHHVGPEETGSPGSGSGSDPQEEELRVTSSNKKPSSVDRSDWLQKRLTHKGDDKLRNFYNLCLYDAVTIDRVNITDPTPKWSTTYMRQTHRYLAQKKPQNIREGRMTINSLVNCRRI